MFDKDLFLSLCEKYDVELSETATRPMIREGIEVHAITDDDGYDFQSTKACDELEEIKEGLKHIF